MNYKLLILVSIFLTGCSFSCGFNVNSETKDEPRKIETFQAEVIDVQLTNNWFSGQRYFTAIQFENGKVLTIESSGYVFPVGSQIECSAKEGSYSHRVFKSDRSRKEVSSIIDKNCKLNN